MKLTKQEIKFLKRDGITTYADIKNYEDSAKNIYIYLNGQRVTQREAKKRCGWRKFIQSLAYVVNHKRCAAEVRACVIKSYIFTWKGRNYK